MGKAARVTTKGIATMSGLETYNGFSFVSDAKTWLSKNVEVRFASTAIANIDYLASYSHRAQFSISSGALMVDESSYNNNFVARSGQMVAPVQCYLKSVIGFINGAACSGCEEPFTIVISIWKKPTNAPGTANTAVGLLFQQEITSLAGTGNTYCNKIDGTTDVRVGDNSYTVDAEDGIIVSVRWKEEGGERGCCNINANFEMTFETIASQTTTEEVLIPLTMADNSGKASTVLSPNTSFFETEID